MRIEWRAGFKAIASELIEREDGLVDLAGRRSGPALPPPRLLGPYEPLLLGWASREAILGSNDGVVSGGLFRPFALVRGRAAATWRMEGDKLVLAPFGSIARDVVAALEDDTLDVARFFAARTSPAAGPARLRRGRGA